MSAEENKALVRRFVEEAQSQHKLDVADELFDPNIVNHAVFPGLPLELSVLEGFKVFFTGILKAFPDLHATIRTQVAEGDKVVTHKTFHGTHQGEFMGTPPTGKHVEFDIIDIFRIANGKMTEHWAVADLLGLMQQLGVIPTPGQPSK